MSILARKEKLLEYDITETALCVSEMGSHNGIEDVELTAQNV
jgi:hypothetical protein